MNKQYTWVSEYRRRKFFERQKEKQYKREYNNELGLNIKTIAVMLDLDGTIDNIDDEKVKLFIKQLEVIRKKFGANKGIISISTHYSNSNKIREVLDIFSRNLPKFIEIGISFYYGGTYDYAKNLDTFKGDKFNFDKDETFYSCYVSSFEFNNQWFAIIDDGISEDTYKKYKDRHPMLLCRPSQRKVCDLKNNLMSISTTTIGFDGVIEMFDKYIESIQHLYPIEILQMQRDMITHLSSLELLNKLWKRDFAFLERYFKEGCADEDDYNHILNSLSYITRNQLLNREELMSLKRMLELIEKHYRLNEEDQNVEMVLKLQKSFEITSE